jgi:hypothetical protein
MPTHRPKFAKECAFTDPRKIVFKKFPTLQKNKNTQRTQPTTDKHFDNLHRLYDWTRKKKGIR